MTTETITTRVTRLLAAAAVWSACGASALAAPATALAFPHNPSRPTGPTSVAVGVSLAVDQGAGVGAQFPHNPG